MKSPDTLDSLADHLGIGRRTGLAASEQLVSDTVRRDLAAHSQAYITTYRRIYGNVFNADDAAELFSVYSQSAECRARYHGTVHESSRWLRDKAFEEALDEPRCPNWVVFMSGGSAVGKSTAAPVIAKQTPVLIYDTTLSVLAGARRTIFQVLNVGKRVSLVHIQRPIEDAIRANVDRANNMLGAGRLTSNTSMIRTHKGAAETIISLSQEFRADARVSCTTFINNNCGEGDQEPKKLSDRLREIVAAALKMYGGKPEMLVRDFPQYDRRVNRAGELVK